MDLVKEKLRDMLDFVMENESLNEFVKLDLGNMILEIENILDDY